jgi:hypothetical protein
VIRSSPVQSAGKRPASPQLWRRRKPSSPPPPVALPSLDRLAGLIERVVELVDEVSGTPAKAPSQPPPAPQRALPAPLAADGSWLAFVPSPQGYTLVDRPGSLPPPGNELDLDGIRYRVLRHAPSPLPGDGRRCAVVEREEPSQPDRTSDA